MPGQVRSVLAVHGGHAYYKPTLYNAINPFYWITKFENVSISAHLLWTSFIDTCYSDTTAHCMCCQKNTNTGFASPELVTFGFKMHLLIPF